MVAQQWLLSWWTRRSMLLMWATPEQSFLVVAKVRASFREYSILELIVLDLYHLILISNLLIATVSWNYNLCTSGSACHANSSNGWRTAGSPSCTHAPERVKSETFRACSSWFLMTWLLSRREKGSSHSISSHWMTGVEFLKYGQGLMSASAQWEYNAHFPQNIWHPIKAPSALFEFFSAYSSCTFCGSQAKQRWREKAHWKCWWGCCLGRHLESGRRSRSQPSFWR